MDKIVGNIKAGMQRLGSYALVFIMVILAISTARNIGKVAQIRHDIKEEKERVAKIEAENEKLQKQVQNIQGVEFIEREIRNKLGLVKEGEAVVVLPDPEVLRKLAPSLNEESDVLPDPNWKKWLNLFVS